MNEASSSCPPPLTILPGPRVTHVSSRSPPPLIFLKNVLDNRKDSGDFRRDSNEKSRKAPDHGNQWDSDGLDTDCVPLAFDPLSLPEEDGRPMPHGRNSNEFWHLCVRAEKLVSQCNMNQFLARCRVMEVLITNWEKNIEIEIVPLASGLWISFMHFKLVSFVTTICSYYLFFPEKRYEQFRNDIYHQEMSHHVEGNT